MASFVAMIGIDEDELHGLVGKHVPRAGGISPKYTYDFCHGRDVRKEQLLQRIAIECLLGIDTQGVTPEIHTGHCYGFFGIYNLDTHKGGRLTLPTAEFHEPTAGREALHHVGVEWRVGKPVLPQLLFMIIVLHDLTSVKLIEPIYVNDRDLKAPVFLSEPRQHRRFACCHVWQLYVGGRELCAMIRTVGFCVDVVYLEPFATICFDDVVYERFHVRVPDFVTTQSLSGFVLGV